MSEPKKIRRLSKLNASEVSLVNRGAIRRPFLVIKNLEGEPMADGQAPVVPQLNNAQEAAFAQILGRYAQVSKAEDAGDDAGVAESEGLDERCVAALKAVYRILLPFKGQIPEDAVDDMLAELDLDDTGDDGQDAETEEVNEDDQGTDSTPEEDTAMAKDFDPEDLKKAADWSPSKPDGSSDADHLKAVAAAKDAYAKAIGKGADDEDEDEEDEDDVKKSAVTKAALPEMSNDALHRIAKAEAARAEEVRKREALEERIAKMEDDKQLAAYEASVRSECQTLGKDPAVVAAKIKKAYSVDKEAGDDYVAMLRLSADAAKKTVFKAYGTSPNASFGGGSVPTTQGTPQQRFDAMVASVIQKGEAPDEVAANMIVLKTAAGQAAYNEIHGGRN